MNPGVPIKSVEHIERVRAVVNSTAETYGAWCCVSRKFFCLNLKHFDRIKIKFQSSIDRIETTQ